MLEDMQYRDTERLDLNATDPDGRTIWGISLGEFWVTFVEMHEDLVIVTHANRFSRFRPPLSRLGL